jgi:hypothetical protein
MTPGEAFHALGIRPGTSRARGHAAYRELVKLWHPDRYSPGSPLGELAERADAPPTPAGRTIQAGQPRAPAGVRSARPPAPGPGVR